LGLTKPNRRFGHELPKVKGGVSGSQHYFLHLMDHASHGAKSTLHRCASLIQGLRECVLFQVFIQRLWRGLLLQATIQGWWL